MPKKGMKKWLYIEPDTEAPLRISAKERPSLETMPDSGTWIVYEWVLHEADNEHRWCIPCFPEIVWESINKLIFVGEIPKKKSSQPKPSLPTKRSKHGK